MEVWYNTTVPMVRTEGEKNSTYENTLNPTGKTLESRGVVLGSLHKVDRRDPDTNM